MSTYSSNTRRGRNERPRRAYDPSPSPRRSSSPTLVDRSRSARRRSTSSGSSESTISIAREEGYPGHDSTRGGSNYYGHGQQRSMTQSKDSAAKLAIAFGAFSIFAGVMHFAAKRKAKQREEDERIRQKKMRKNGGREGEQERKWKSRKEQDRIRDKYDRPMIEAARSERGSAGRSKYGSEVGRAGRKR